MGLRVGYAGSLLPIEVQEKMRNCKNDLSVMIRRIQSARYTDTHCHTMLSHHAVPVVAITWYSKLVILSYVLYCVLN